MTHGPSVLALLAFISLTGCSEPPAPASKGVGHSRIVTLAPNLTELVFAAGAGDALVGVSAWSDFPPEAADLPLIGDAFTIDQEQLAILQPDLLLAWHAGTPEHVIDELRNAGYRVEVLRTSRVAEVGAALTRIGELAGTSDAAAKAAWEFERDMDQIAARYRDADSLRVFYQVSRRPLYTINGEHFVSELISLCGGRNIFADLGELAPTVDIEAVIDRDPEVLLASTDGGEDVFAQWLRWEDLAANRFGARYRVPADEIGRATTRLVVALSAVCNALEDARMKRGAHSG